MCNSPLSAHETAYLKFVCSVCFCITHTHTHTTLYLVSNVFFTEKDYAQAHEMSCSPVQEVDDLQGSLCVCVCLYDCNTHNSTEVQMECIPSLPPSTEVGD